MGWRYPQRREYQCHRFLTPDPEPSDVLFLQGFKVPAVCSSEAEPEPQPEPQPGEPGEDDPEDDFPWAFSHI